MRLRSLIFGVMLLPVAIQTGWSQVAQPALTILEPDDQSYLASLVRLRAEVTPDAEVESVEFFVDGSSVCAVREPPFQCTWDAGPAIRPRVVRVVARLTGDRRLVDSVRTLALGVVDETTGTSAVLVPVVVRDWRGRFVRDLTREDFSILEDDVPQDITFFQMENVPLDLVLAVDISGSMARSIDTLKEAMRRFIRTLAGPNQVSLIAFNDRIFEITRNETDPEILIASVDNLPDPYGGTSLLDAIVSALDLHGDDFYRKAVIVFSDGDDQTSLSAIEPVVRRIQESQATVYIITQGERRALERVRSLLETLTRVSGGEPFAIDRIDELQRILEYIREDLQNQYFLTYQSSNPSTDGTWRSIRVATQNGRHRIRAREGYGDTPPR